MYGEEVCDSDWYGCGMVKVRVACAWWGMSLCGVSTLTVCNRLFLMYLEDKIRH